jgi:hypothetical protein
LVKGIGADSSASRAGRVPGTPNCKPKYEPDFPAVRTFSVQPGRIATPAELEGFLAAPVQLPSPRFYPRMESSGWPDYGWVLRGAPKKKDGTPDRSRADYFCCKWALERGNGPQAVIAKLAEVSERAQVEIKRGNPGYLRITVENAATAVGSRPRFRYPGPCRICRPPSVCHRSGVPLAAELELFDKGV